MKFSHSGGDVFEHVGDHWLPLSPAEAQRYLLELQTAIHERHAHHRAAQGLYPLANVGRSALEQSIAAINGEKGI